MEVVAIPTETVYGLAAPLASPQAIERVFELKKRPANNPLIIHIADRSHLTVFARELPPGTQALIDRFWPGPLTLVLPAVPSTVPEGARAGLPTAAFRMPDHEVTLEILRQVGPLVAPSANPSGSPSATSPRHVEEDFGDVVPVVDGGVCPAGVESTIVLFCDGLWKIGRLGALTAEQLATVLGYAPEVVSAKVKEQPLCPGSLYRHYAPEAKLVLGSEEYSGAIPLVVGFSDRNYPGAERVLAMGKSTDPDEVLHHLYETLRLLDRIGATQAWVDIDVPHTGLWATYLERIRRAASS